MKRKLLKLNMEVYVDEAGSNNFNFVPIISEFMG
jgi:hypothetical protein